MYLPIFDTDLRQIGVTGMRTCFLKDIRDWVDRSIHDALQKLFLIICVSCQGLEQHQYLQQLQWSLDESQKNKAKGDESSAHK